MRRNELLAVLTSLLFAVLLFASVGVGDDRWYATVIKAEGCGACERLLHDVRTSPEIGQYRHMAHLRVVDAADPATRRWAKNLKIRVYPTTIIQPPTTGRFGHPATVALKIEGYDGDPARLVQNVKMGLLRYVARRQYDPAVSATYPYSSVCTVVMPSLGFAGSGTLIGVSDDEALVLSCAHVVHRQGLKARLVWPVTGDESEGTVLALNHDIDISLIVCDRPENTEPVKLRIARPGERFINVGFPAYGREFPHWQWATYERTTPDRLWYTARPYPGMSGGATFGMDGAMVGVVIAYHRDGGLSVSGEAVQEFIERYAE